MGKLKDFNKIKQWKFEVYNSDGDVLAGIIHYKRGLNTEEATIDIKNFDKLGGWLKWAWDKAPDKSKLLIDFLENRVNPPNRLFLEERMNEIGIDAYDWIARMKLNNGKVHGDNLYVKVIDLDDKYN